VGPFLSKAMDPPEPDAVKQAVNLLSAIGAFTPNEELTPLGEHLAALSLAPSIGKLLLMGAAFDCLEPILSIAASLSFRSPFLMPLENRAEADAARAELAGNHASDHWALLQAVRAVDDMKRQRRHHDINSFCRVNFLQPSTMHLISGLRVQLVQACSALPCVCLID
jgi:ATP-dependent RNA helicase DHX36